jgi:hypothetical protein
MKKSRLLNQNNAEGAYNKKATKGTNHPTHHESNPRLPVKLIRQ